MKKTGLLMALLATAGVTSLEDIQAQTTNTGLSGEQCRLIAEFTTQDLQDLIGEAIKKAHRLRKPVEVDISHLRLHENEADLGALALLYTISNPHDYTIEITPDKVSVSID